jgi:hypothetical protein
MEQKVETDEIEVRSGKMLRIEISKTNHKYYCMEKDCKNSMLKSMDNICDQSENYKVSDDGDTIEVELSFNDSKQMSKKCNHKTILIKSPFTIIKEFYEPGIYKVVYPKSVEGFINFSIVKSPVVFQEVDEKQLTSQSKRGPEKEKKEEEKIIKFGQGEVYDENGNSVPFTAVSMPESIFKDLDPETRKLLLGLES